MYFVRSRDPLLLTIFALGPIYLAFLVFHSVPGFPLALRTEVLVPGYDTVGSDA